MNVDGAVAEKRRVLSKLKNLVPAQAIGAVVDGNLEKFYDTYGHYVASFPYVFICCSVALSVLLSFGLRHFQQDDDLKQLYTPLQSLSHRERKVEGAFWNWRSPERSGELVERSVHANVTSGDDDSAEAESRMFAVFIMLRGRGKEQNILGSNLCRLVNRINTLMNYQIDYGADGATFTISVDGNEVHNYPARIFCALYFNANFRLNPNVNFFYPYMKAFGMQIYLGTTMTGVLNNENGTIGSIESLNLGYVWFTKDGHFGHFQKLVTRIEHALLPIVANSTLTYALHSDAFVNHEVNKNVSLTLPYLVLSCLLVLLFCVLSNRSFGGRGPSKSCEALMGCLSSVMAIFSAFGLLAFIGVPFNSIVVVTPFLAMAIGIDDTFLAINAWNRADPSLSPEQRLRAAMRESASAITITSLTDIALFGIGAMTDTPAIRIFSLYAATALAFDFLYQLTFVYATMVIGGQMDSSKGHCLMLRNRSVQSVEGLEKCASMTEKRKETPFGGLFKVREHVLWAKVLKRRKWTKSPYHWALSHYAHLMNQGQFQLCALLLYAAYALLSFWGCCNIKVNMSLSMLLVDDSPLHKFFELKDQYMRSSLAVSVHVSRPPEDEQQLKRFFRMVARVEGTKYSTGDRNSLLWLRDYLHYCQDEIGQLALYDHLPSFLADYRYKIYSNMVRWYRNSSDDHAVVVVDRFFFQTYFQTNGQWAQAASLMDELRQVVAQYANFNVTIFQPESYVFDQYSSIPNNTCQTVGIGTLCMMLMTIIFIPHWHSIFWISLTLMSMDLGIIGLLSIWDVTLDPVSMISIVMSLDFPIEYASHLCHCFYRLPSDLDDQRRTFQLLNAVGWPILQGAIAALLATLPLGLVPSYVIRVFFKTVLLIISIGMLHALLWLPITLNVSAARAG